MILTSLSFKNFAQTGRIPLSEKSIVKDSTGTVYSYKEWFSIIGKGEYKLQKTTPGKDEYLLVKREKANNDDNKQIYRGANSGNYIGKKIKFPYMVDLDGQEYWNKNLNHKIVVLNFWFVKCAPCKAEIPLLNQLYWRYRENENIVFLGICLDSRETISNFMKTNPFVYKLVADGREVASIFNVSEYPTNLIVEKGIVKYCTTGFSTKSISGLESTLKGLIKTNNPLIKRTDF